MEYFISALWIALELAEILLFFSAFMKSEKKTGILIGFLITWTVIFMANNLAFLQAIAPFARYAAILCMVLCLFKGRWYTHILLEAVIVLLILVVDSALSYGTCALLHISLSELVWRKFTYAMAGTLSKLILLLCTWLLYRVRKGSGLKGVHGKWLLLTFLFPIISIVIIVLNYINNREAEDVSFGVFLVSIVLAIANIGIIYLIHSMEKSTIRQQEVALLKQQMDHQKANYISLESSYRTQRKASHEFERHIQTLSELLAQEEYHTATDYICQLKANRAHKAFSIKTNHPVVDVILNQKYQMAKEKQITMHMQVNDLSSVSIQTDLLVVLLSNLLDNAIEECQRIDSHKEVFCSLLCNESFYVSVRNTSHPVEILNNEIIKRRENDYEHGYGVPAIKYVLESLDAEYAFAYENGWFQFVADIPVKK